LKIVRDSPAHDVKRGEGRHAGIDKVTLEDDRMVSRPRDGERGRESRDAASSHDEPHAAKLSDRRARYYACAAEDDGVMEQPFGGAHGTVEALNVGVPRAVEVNGRTVWTAIWKSPVEGRVALRGVNLDGDEQADRTVHGGPDKAVYAYAAEDTEWWEDELATALGPGAFGENLTVSGLPVSHAVIGERWAVGSALLEVAQPRLPCFKLGLRMNDPRFLKRFADAGRPGAYLRVLGEGDIGAGDRIDVVRRPPHGVTSALVSRALLRDPRLLVEALEAPELPHDLKDWMRERIKEAPKP
jgi:MOSC domain-containing protein YiiM